MSKDQQGNVLQVHCTKSPSFANPTLLCLFPCKKIKSSCFVINSKGGSLAPTSDALQAHSTNSPSFANPTPLCLFPCKQIKLSCSRSVPVSTNERQFYLKFLIGVLTELCLCIYQTGRAGRNNSIFHQILCQLKLLFCHKP